MQSSVFFLFAVFVSLLNADEPKNENTASQLIEIYWLPCITEVTCTEERTIDLKRFNDISRKIDVLIGQENGITLNNFDIIRLAQFEVKTNGRFDKGAILNIILSDVAYYIDFSQRYVAQKSITTSNIHPLSNKSYTEYILSFIYMYMIGNMEAKIAETYHTSSFKDGELEYVRYDFVPVTLTNSQTVPLISLCKLNKSSIKSNSKEQPIDIFFFLLGSYGDTCIYETLGIDLKQLKKAISQWENQSEKVEVFEFNDFSASSVVIPSATFQDGARCQYAPCNRCSVRELEGIAESM